MRVVCFLEQWWSVDVARRMLFWRWSVCVSEVGALILGMLRLWEVVWSHVLAALTGTHRRTATIEPL
jgi:hypothetical protein